MSAEIWVSIAVLALPFVGLLLPVSWLHNTDDDIHW